MERFRVKDLLLVLMEFYMLASFRKMKKMALENSRNLTRTRSMLATSARIRRREKDSLGTFRISQLESGLLRTMICKESEFSHIKTLCTSTSETLKRERWTDLVERAKMD